MSPAKNSWYTRAVLRAAPFAVLLLTMLPSGLAQAADLSSAAAASGRPRECSSRTRKLGQGPTVWERARVPGLGPYCDLLSRAKAQLATNPEAASKFASQADKELPGRAAPAVMRARAALAQGKIDEAAQEFAKAKALDPRSVEDPATMHDLAQVLRRTGKTEEALGVYRALVPRIDLLGTLDRRVSVLLEAAHLSMAVEASKTTNSTAAPASSHLDEAVAYLREARQRPPTQLSGDVLLSLVLALDRSGDKVQADAALADAQRVGVRLKTGSLDYLAATEDKLALEALAAEGTDRALAVKQWEAYLAGAGGKGKWAVAARGRLDGLKGTAGRASAAPAKPAPKGTK